MITPARRSSPSGIRRSPLYAFITISSPHPCRRPTGRWRAGWPPPAECPVSPGWLRGLGPPDRAVGPHLQAGGVTLPPPTSSGRVLSAAVGPRSVPGWPNAPGPYLASSRTVTGKRRESRYGNGWGHAVPDKENEMAGKVFVAGTDGSEQ